MLCNMKPLHPKGKDTHKQVSCRLCASTHLHAPHKLADHMATLLQHIAYVGHVPLLVVLSVSHGESQVAAVADAA